MILPNFHSGCDRDSVMPPLVSRCMISPLEKALGYRRWFLVLAVAACAPAESPFQISNILDS